MMTTETKDGRRLVLTGREIAEQVTCSTCWQKGFRAVLYLDPAQSRPTRAFCPICGLERQRVKPTG